MTNSKLNHNLVGNNGDFTRNNCQINNVLEEEDEDGEEKGDVILVNSKCDLIPSVLLDGGGSSCTTTTTTKEGTTELTPINGVHLSNDEHSFHDDNVNDDTRNPQNKNLLIFNKQSTLETNQQQPNKLIKCRNDFKTETCI